ncbi:MAG: branched-chain amino acid ABC transporter permease [Candidatus Peribacteraceae bacterium]|nr:branched-chain amino acid ABC transporter permease [Candidatus Peribacteraceae bacterium]
MLSCLLPTGNYALHLLAITSMTMVHVLGYNVIFGKGKILHFGPIAVSLASGYGTFVTLTWTGSYLLAVPIGIAMAVLLSLLFTWLSLRLEPDGLGILTIAMHQIVLTVVLNWTPVTRGALGLPQIPRMPWLQSNVALTSAVVLVATAWFFLMLLFERSTYGRQLQALAEHEWYAKALGINRPRLYLIAFLIGGIGAFITNLFYHQYLYLVHPSDFLFPVLIFYVMIIVAGKPGSTMGVALSTILLIFLREELRCLPIAASVLGPLRMMLFGIILLAAVWYRRDSLFPKKRTI